MRYGGKDGLGRVEGLWVARKAGGALKAELSENTIPGVRGR